MTSTIYPIRNFFPGQDPARGLPGHPRIRLHEDHLRASVQTVAAAAATATWGHLGEGELHRERISGTKNRRDYVHVQQARYPIQLHGQEHRGQKKGTRCEFNRPTRDGRYVELTKTSPAEAGAIVISVLVWAKTYIKNTRFESLSLMDTLHVLAKVNENLGLQKLF